MPIPDIDKLEVLPGPYEILELGDGGVKELVVTKYTLGKMVIHPRPMGMSKAIVALRVYVTELVKPLYPDYYDITSQTLIAQLEPVLAAGGYERKKFIITKYGSGPSARFSLEVRSL